jgi:hypothetical protein
MINLGFKLAFVGSVAATVGLMASIAKRLVVTESVWQPIDIVYDSVQVPFFYPWPIYLVVGAMLAFLYLRSGRR